jgi:hypothetical protein
MVFNADLADNFLGFLAFTRNFFGEKRVKLGVSL